jgi:endonuclease/exonuclease/phosphatase (EEP) superfamily protein YafD
VLFHNPTPDVAAARLLATEADVLVITEYTAEAKTAFAAGGVHEAYPYRVEQPRHGAFGAAVFSRYPITRSELIDLAGAATIDLDLDLPGGTTRLIAVHTLQPLAGLDTLRTQLRILDRQARRSERPTILAGDFNATVDHAAFRALLEHGLRDAHLERGAGRTTTWPADHRFPAFTQLDHVLVSDDLAVLAAGDLEVPGSDHRAVTARLAVALAR